MMSLVLLGGSKICIKELSGNIVNTAQALLKAEFPHILGLQDTLRGVRLLSIQFRKGEVYLFKS